MYTIKNRTIYCSGIKLAVAISTAGTFLAAQIDVFIHHLVDLKTQLLVDFFSDHFSIDEERHEKSNCHHEQDDQNGKPKSSGLIIVLLIVVFLDEAYAFSGGIDQRVANGFEYFWGFEQAIEVTIIDCDFRIEVDAHLTRFFIGLSENVRTSICDFADGFI